MFTKRISLFIGAIVSAISLSGMGGCGANVEPESSQRVHEDYRNAKNRIAYGKADPEEHGEYHPINTTDTAEEQDADPTKETVDADDDLEEI